MKIIKNIHVKKGAPSKRESVSPIIAAPDHSSFIVSI
jgi:hypothetical protein